MATRFPLRRRRGSVRLVVTTTGSTVSRAINVGGFTGTNLAGQIIWNTSSGSITIQAANSTKTTSWTDLFTLTHTNKNRKQSTVGGTFQYLRAESTHIATTAGAEVYLSLP